MFAFKPQTKERRAFSSLTCTVMAESKKRNFLGRLNWSRPRIEAENQLDWIIDQQKRARIQIGAEALGMEGLG